MLLHLNGWPGVGKLTVGRIVARQLEGRLLDSHSIYNVAFSLTEFRSAAFYETVRAVRDVALQRAATIPRTIPIVMTNAYADSAWGNENWDAVVALAKTRGSMLFAVTLDCAPKENARRAALPDREYLGKLRDPSELLKLRTRHLLPCRGADHLLYIDNSAIDPANCAERIMSWIRAAKGE
jgi:predicted kinase